VFGFEPVTGVVAYLIQAILDTEGVTDIANEPTFELLDRELTITAALVVGDVVTDIDLAVTP
jgi:hypothetical protein